MKRETLYELTSFAPDDSAASHMVRVIAAQALADEDWKITYDRVMAGPFGFPEDNPRIAEEHSELPAELDPWMTAYGAWWLDPENAVVPLHEHACSLGVRPREKVSTPELVASAIGAQLWCAATGVTDLERAPSLGSNAVRSMAAILARSCGHGPVVAPVSGTAHEVWRLRRMDPYIDHVFGWTREQLSEPEARWALLAACSDLCWRSPRPSLTTSGAFYARARLAELGI